MRIPRLAEAVPTVENGSWKLLPDGRMETTWRIRDSAFWHDGTRVTSADFVFATQVDQDRELEIPSYSAYELIERIDATDERTITVTWSKPYIEADLMFSHEVGLPLPKHILEPALQDKAAFLGIPYWSEQYVGAGPFRVHEWVADSHIILRAHDGYALGRPKLDEIEIRFFPDPTTLLANMLSGVDIAIGRAVSLDQALQVKEQWKEGRILPKMRGWMPINPQFVNANPPIVTDLRFRRAMLQAIDRPLLKESIMAGQGDIAHSFVSSDTREYGDIESSIVRYPHDARAAAQGLEALGYQKGADGLYQDASGQRLTVSVYTTTQNANHVPATSIVADAWQRLGVTVEQTHIPPQRARDREYRATFPTFELVQTGNSTKVSDVMRYHSTSTPLAENNFTATGNNPRYRHPDLDSSLERYISTIPWGERMQALADVVRHMSENLTHMGLVFHVDPTMVSNRLRNVTYMTDQSTQAWNAYEWDLTE
jgi:peptide/nickel transport system substrate-binding protein